MADAMFSFEQNETGVPSVYKPSVDYCNGDEAQDIQNQSQHYTPEPCQKPDLGCTSVSHGGSGLGSHNGEPSKKGFTLLADHQLQNEICPTTGFPGVRAATQHYLDEAMRMKDGPILNFVDFGDGNHSQFSSREISESLIKPGPPQIHTEIETELGTDAVSPKTDHKHLTAEEIFMVAGEMFLLSCSQGVEELSTFRHPVGMPYSDISEEQIKDVELAGSLFSAAQCVAHEQFTRAIRLLNHCDLLSSCKGSTVQRVAYYFIEALHERIDRHKGTYSMKDLGNLEEFDIKEAVVSPNPIILACHREIPFTHVLHYAGVQAIVENVASAKTVHIIDLGIRFGVCWIILLQALASLKESSPLEMLKITAVGTMSKSKIQDTGERLSTFATSLNLPFTFNIVMVDDLLDLSEGHFQLDDDEVVAIYAPVLLKTLLFNPNRLDHLMRVIRSINPCIMVMLELEASINSPCFGSRFTEALFFYSSFFDCLATCMDSSSPNRFATESQICGQAIRNIIAMEGEDRIVRHVKLSVWRTFFARFGLVESKLSRSSLYQASLVLKEIRVAKYCNLKVDGKSLVICWKGTPMVSVSAWKFA